MIYTGYLIDLSQDILRGTLLFIVTVLNLWIVFNPFNTIKWDSNSLHIRFKKHNDRYAFNRSGIESVELKLNDLYIKKKSGEEHHFDVTDMYLSYSEINRFRKDFAS